MSLRHTLTSLAIRLGPENPLVGWMTRRRCRQHGAELVRRGNILELNNNGRIMRLSLRHFVYAPDLSQHFERYFAPLIPEMRDGVSLLDYSSPRLQTYARSGLQFELASFPEEESAIEGYFHWYLPKPGDTVFDIGAHCGVSTYHFSKLVGREGRVIAFEPDPLNYSLLLRNIARHALENVTPLKIAVAGSRGTATFHCEGTIGSGLSRHSSRASVGTVETVDTITLADAFEEWGSPAFCKIDIEGAEIEVVSAAAAHQMLGQSDTHFALDTNHFVDGSLTNNAIERVFAACGYEAESSKVEGLMTTWARPAAIK